jgi:hypothetical protein
MAQEPEFDAFQKAVDELLQAAEVAAPYLIGEATEKPAKAYASLQAAIRKLRKVRKVRNP